ncbi:MAG: type II toxin-antitoxin system HigB family toxin [Xenococcaceae cyanobacterium MO_188.B19]|nr:type II toxin-antitoxin system HigB family toxin [Xenococcaceae cyanobacterium MO_188.B19]
MRVVSKKALRDFWKQHSKAKPSLLLWHERISKIQFINFQEIRQVFSSADLVGNFIVFNIGGNNYRLIAYIDYEAQMLFIRAILTHAEYDKENWKNDDWYQKS